MKTLTPAQLTRLAELQTANAANRAAWLEITKGKRNSISAEESAALTKVAPFTNELRAELETLLFLSTPAQKEFVYPSETLTRANKWAFAPGFGAYKLTGFIGNSLMTVTELGAEFTANMGDKRRSVRAVGINGEAYCGTIFGTYARMRPCKADVLQR